MTTLIPKYDQGATGAVNRPINEKLAESVSVKDFGAVGDGVTDDTAAITAACSSLTSNATLYFPVGTYKYTNGMTFPLPVTLKGENGAILNYIGNGKAITLGPTNITTTAGADYGSYVIDGLCFTGGASMTHGIFIPSFVVYPTIRNCRFYRFGNSTSYAIWAAGFNFQVLIQNNQYLNDEAVARNFLRTDGYASGLGYDSGNSHLTCVGNNISATSGYGVGVGISNTGAGDIIVGNKIEGFSPNIRLGSSANGSIVSKNYFEVVTGNCIEFGDLPSGYAPSAYLTGVTIEDNYCNMHGTDGVGNAGSFVAKTVGNTLTGIKFSTIQYNKVLNISLSVPIVLLNNLSSQIGNAGTGNTDGQNLKTAYLRSIANNITAWRGEGAQALGLNTGVSSFSSPQIASAFIDINNVVHLSGKLKATSTSIPPNTILAFLPLGYFPSALVLVSVYDEATVTTTYLAISNSGGVSCGITLTSSSQLHLEGVSFCLEGS